VANLKKMPQSLRLFLCGLGMTLAPFLIFTAYLFVARDFDGLAMGTSVVVGLIAIAALPVGSWFRWGLGLLYVPACGFLLFLYGVMFVCVRYDACL